MQCCCAPLIQWMGIMQMCHKVLHPKVEDTKLDSKTREVVAQWLSEYSVAKHMVTQETSWLLSIINTMYGARQHYEHQKQKDIYREAFQQISQVNAKFAVLLLQMKRVMQVDPDGKNGLWQMAELIVDVFEAQLLQHDTELNFYVASCDDLKAQQKNWEELLQICTTTSSDEIKTNFREGIRMVTK